MLHPPSLPPYSVIFTVSGTVTLSEPLESPPFSPHMGLKIEQFNDILRSNKKDTKISPDVFVS